MPAVNLNEVLQRRKCQDSTRQSEEDMEEWWVVDALCSSITIWLKQMRMQWKIHLSNSNSILTLRTKLGSDSLSCNKSQQHLAISGTLNNSTMIGVGFISIQARLSKRRESSKKPKHLSPSRKFRGHRPLLLWQASIVSQLAQYHSRVNTSANQIMQILLLLHRQMEAVWWWAAIIIYLRITRFRSVSWARRSVRTCSQICEALSRGEDRVINKEAPVARLHLQI